MQPQERFKLVASTLESLSDADLGALLAQAEPLGSGIGGVRTVINVGGVQVFVKKVPLTEIEIHTAGESTRNLFDMPVGCHYGVGSPGFGVWREVAANRIATSLVTDGQVGCFAAMYHYRTMEGPASDGPLADELRDVEVLVDSWHGSAGVRRRVEAITAATSYVALFLEYIPTTVPEWLKGQVDQGREAASSAIDLIERCLVRDVPKMNAAGLFHFDAHLDNLMTDGKQIYFADFGLATSPSFELSETERDFLSRNANHDVAHTITRLVDWLVTEFASPPSTEARDALIQTVASTRALPVSMNTSARRVVERYAPVAAIVNDFYAQLHSGDRTTSFPAHAIAEACDAAGLPVTKL